MKFCASCGSALEFFEFLDGELCSNCVGNKKKPQAHSKTPDKNNQHSLGELSDMVLGVENNNIVLKSPEGWVLWSAPITKKDKLHNVLTRAQRILKIRQKRKK